jgi:hypothetical protein
MPKRYRFSFTAASLQVPLMIELAMKIIEQEITPDQLMPEDIGKERSKTNKRGLTEMKIRLNTLLREEIELLAYGDANEQRYISLIAFARSYLFFRDFVIEVIAEKIVVFDFYLTDMDYNAFFNKKTLDHPEADDLTDSTKDKIKRVCFKVLELGGLINNIKERKIIIPILSQRLSSILENKRQDLKLLLN